MTIAYIGMGGNMASPAGEPAATLAVAFERLGELGELRAHSRLYRTAPVGVVDQPYFVNAVAALATPLGPLALLEKLQQIEKEFGRNRAEEMRFGPRTLDLDIELYGDWRMGGASLELPHPRMKERAFVLRPLAEIAPELHVPGSGQTVAQLLAALGGLEADVAVALGE